MTIHIEVVPANIIAALKEDMPKRRMDNSPWLSGTPEGMKEINSRHRFSEFCYVASVDWTTAITCGPGSVGVVNLGSTPIGITNSFGKLIHTLEPGELIVEKTQLLVYEPKRFGKIEGVLLLK